jgi:hypothetical protein
VNASLHKYRFSLTTNIMEIETELSDQYNDLRFYGGITWAWMRDLDVPVELFRVVFVDWSVARSTLEECKTEEIFSLLFVVVS